MTLEDYAKIAAAGASAPLTALIIKFFSDRKAVKEATRQREIDGTSSAQVAAIGSFKDLLASYQHREEELAEENRKLRIEVNALRERHDTLKRITAPMMLLLVEDDQGAVLSITRFLQDSEFQVVACGTWADAKKALVTSPDIVIADLTLPDSIPEETVGRLAEYKRQHPSVPIGIITGTTLIEDIIAPQHVRIAHKADVMTTPEKFKTFLYSVLDY